MRNRGSGFLAAAVILSATPFSQRALAQDTPGPGVQTSGPGRGKTEASFDSRSAQQRRSCDAGARARQNWILGRRRIDCGTRRQQPAD